MTSRSTPLVGNESGRRLGEGTAGRVAGVGRSGDEHSWCYRKRARLHSGSMLWFTIFFLVILKIPAAYLGYVIWWAVKDPPEPGTNGGYERMPSSGEDGGGTAWRRPSRSSIPGRRPGPHGSPARRPQPVLAPGRAEKRS
jgi:hypothetical protein